MLQSMSRIGIDLERQWLYNTRAFEKGLPTYHHAAFLPLSTAVRQGLRTEALIHSEAFRLPPSHSA